MDPELFLYVDKALNISPKSPIDVHLVSCLLTALFNSLLNSFP